MLFQRAAVIGIGLIGGSFALAARQRGLVGHVTGVARTRTTLDAALRLGAADDATSDAVAAVAGADLVYLATPVR
ncbi:MAG TPA: prephenate dehydrogenase/arogenate dehydrogenase family protein, partial [Armatimonadota bacterium]|nr:prephenate dehydrogenase/arogenate dehydrogenase family protein [Armatimonadota bacterium]